MAKGEIRKAIVRQAAWNRSPLYAWVLENRHQIEAALCDMGRPSWVAIAKVATDAGILGADKKPPTGSSVFNCWKRVSSDEKLRQARLSEVNEARRTRHAGRAVRLPADQPHPTVRSLAAAPAREVPVQHSTAEHSVAPAPAAARPVRKYEFKPARMRTDEETQAFVAKEREAEAARLEATYGKKKP